MPNTRTKIRHGLILQGVLAEALRRQGILFDETPSYESDSEEPDFLIPNSVDPQFVVETHQTDARDHFRMKTLRSLTAVVEAKVFFGNSIIAANVLFGDPDAEVPESNLDAMCGIFDVNVILYRAYGNDIQHLRDLESHSMELAADGSISTDEAARTVANAHADCVIRIGELFRGHTDGAKANPGNFDIWDSERNRRSALGSPPQPGSPTYYKKNMVRSLYFTDADFTAMRDADSVADWPSSAVRQAISVRVVEVSEEMHGDEVLVDEEFARFLNDNETDHLRALCRGNLDAMDNMRYFFQDIRDASRRRRMVEVFLEFLNGSELSRREAFEESFANGTFAGIDHTRCWIADLMPLCLNRSHNDFNRAMFSHPDYSQNLGNPFNNITIRSPRLGNERANFCDVALSVFESELSEAEEGLGRTIDREDLDSRLLRLRITGSMRLQYLDPLSLLIRSIAEARGLVFDNLKIGSLLSDFSGVPAVGAFDFFSIASPDGTQAVRINAIAAEGNPRDKAKEWGARQLATLSRFENGAFVSPSGQTAVFVLDGTWDQPDVTRLFRSGWNHIIRMAELEGLLDQCFD